MSKRIKHDREMPQLSPARYQFTKPSPSAVQSQLISCFTLVELLTVIGIIAILAAMLMPALSSARTQVKKGAIKSEIQNLEVAMTSYYRDWGAYPPDMADIDGDTSEESSAECLVYYLNTTFRTSPSGDEEKATKNGGPYYEFEASRLTEDPDGNGTPEFSHNVYVDHFGVRADTSYYQFQNNEAAGGGGVHPSSVDIWSAGEDGEDEVSSELNSGNLTQDTVGDVDLGDDIGNW